jgi:hypothetical protein
MRGVAMKRVWLWLPAAFLVTGAIGCRGMGRPGMAAPGPASYQQTLAQQFDPYPENETGPPIVGARPREFQQPIAETPRVQWSPWPWKR